MSDDVLSRIAAWCAADPKLTFLEEGPAVEVAGEPPLRLQLGLGEEEILLSHHLEVTGSDEGAVAQARELVNKRGSLMRGTAEAVGDGLAVSVEYPIYLDGLNRQTFLLATQEVAGALDAVSALGGRAEARSAAAAPVEALAPVETVAPVVAATAAAAAVPFTPAADTIQVPSTPVQPAAFTPTHEVPAGGMSAWSHPDPSLQPAARLEARVQLRVDETRGAWARVTGSNGWTGWVDARRLAPLGGAVTPAVTTAPGMAVPAATAPSPVVTAPMAAIWQATHQVPAGGLPAWAVPDPAQAQVAQLAERVQLRVEEMRGAWARVSAENGWSGWVDGRRLAALGTGAAAGKGALSLGGIKIRPLPLIGGVALIVATFVNWLQLGSSNGFQIGLPFLWRGWEHGADNPDLGIFTLIIGIAGVLLAVLPRTSALALRLLGLLAVVIAVVFAVQVMLWAGDWGGGAGDAFTDGMSFAPYVALGGGILMLLARKD